MPVFTIYLRKKTNTGSTWFPTKLKYKMLSAKLKPLHQSVSAVCADVDHNNSNLLLNLGTHAKAISAYQSLFLYIFSIRQSSAAQICGQCANMCEATAKKYPRSYETQSFWGQLRNSLECAHILGVAKQAVDGEFITSLGRIHYSLIYIIYIVIDYLFI